MSLSQQVQNIIAQRKPQLPVIDGKRTALDGITSSLDGLRGFLSANSARVAEDKRPGVSAICESIGRTMEHCRTQQFELEKIHARFNRDSLNIGVVGLPKQGKSTLLLSLSGLDESVVPTGNDFTTGAASKIYNDPSVERGKEYAIISFHTEQSFLRDVVWPFWDDQRMGFSGRIPKPPSVDQFGAMGAPSPSDPNDVTAVALANELRKVSEEMPRFRPLLGKAPLRAERADIRSYVAQHDSDDKTPLSNWRAVKVAEIHCAFPNTEAANVTLLDTPGLGQLTVGLESYVREVIGSEIDLAVMVINPSPQGPVVTQPTTDLYTLLARALPDLQISEWTALAVNKTPHNEGVLNIFERNLQNVPALQFNAGKANVSCRSEAETAVFFSSCLEYLTRNIARLDQVYLDRRMGELNALSQECRAILSTIRDLFPESKSVLSGKDKFFQEQFEQVWDSQLGLALNSLVNRYRTESSDAGMDKIAAATNEIEQNLLEQENAELNLKTPEEIANTPGQTLKWIGNTAQDLRTRFAKYFEKMDLTLKESFDEVRSEFWRALNNENAGMLGKSEEFRRVSESTTQEQFLFLSTIFQDIDDAEDLAVYFSKAATMYPAYDAFMKHRIRKHLARLEEGTTEFEESVKQWASRAPEIESAKGARKAFIVAWKDCRADALAELRDELAEEVRLAKFAFADELKSNMLYLGGSKKAEQRVEVLYDKLKSQIWHEEYVAGQADILFQAQLRQYTLSLAGDLNKI